MTYTLTTPLYYVNDKPHLGSTYTTIACDALARFKRLSGQDVIFITGVDEHGQKIQRSAESKKLTPEQHCDAISATYLNLWDKWNISNDRFVRTTDVKHEELVKAFFTRVLSSGDIYLGKQTGYYCVGCEEFKEVNDKDQKPFCELHNKQLEWRNEENLFFRLSKYQQQIENLISEEEFISPISRLNEVKKFVDRGLKDFSISRINVSWGIDVPGHEGHTFYVWFDALLGYLSALLENESNSKLDDIHNLGWPASVHIIGKDILRFHAIYWPAMLMSANLPLPKKLYSHGFLTRDGRKMSKSLGNSLDPYKLFDYFGPDAVRWYLLKEIKFGNDGDFQINRFIDIVNNDLANTIGNLLNRTISMSRKWFNNSVPECQDVLFSNNQLKLKTQSYVNKYLKHMSELRFDEASESILLLAIYANTYISENEPWNLIKNPSNSKDVAAIIYSVLESCRIVGLLLSPIVPVYSNCVISQLGLLEVNSSWKQALEWGQLKGGSILPDPKPIMSRLEIPEEYA